MTDPLADVINPVSTLVVAISTVALAIITAYYAKQTRELARNEFSPLCFPSIVPKQEDSIFSLYLEIKNIGNGMANNIKVEYNVKDAKDSKHIKTITLLRSQEPEEYHITSNIDEAGNPISQTRDEWLEAIKKTHKIVNVKISYYDIFGSKHKIKKRSTYNSL